MKVMKKRFITLSLCVLASVGIASAQNSKMNSSDGGSKHEIRLSVSDGLTLTSVDILGMGLADATLGSKRTDEKASIIYGSRLSICHQPLQSGSRSRICTYKQQACTQRRKSTINQRKGT